MRKISALFFFLFFSQVIYGQSDSLKANNTFIGLNLFRMAVGDIELDVMQKINNDITVGVSAGYDFNCLDKQFSTDYGSKKESFPREDKEELSNSQSRYMWGNGFAGRIYIDYNFSSKNKRQHFVSLEGLWKKRDYEGHFFGEGRIVHYESAGQTIRGLTFYYGTNYQIAKHLILRLHTGAGFRILNSHIKRPGYNFDSRDWPPTELNYQKVIPSLHLGLSILAGF